jgi:hypothetical protein
MLCLGSAADLCKSAMLHIEHKLHDEQLAHSAHLLLQIHDELVWEVSSAQLTNVRGESSCHNPTYTILGPIVPFFYMKHFTYASVYL